MVMDFAFLSCFHDLLCRVTVRCLKLTPTPMHDDSELSDDAKLGAPADAIRSFKKKRQKRSARYAKWVQRTLTSLELLVFIAVVAPLMKIHYQLFKESKDKVEAASDCEPGVLFDLCDESRSVCCKALKDLTSMLFDPSREQWSLLRSRLGDQHLWPGELMLKARHCLMGLLGSAWRRLVKRWRQWPWLLCNMVDPRIPEADRRQWATTFMDENVTPDCCLDLFSRKLRRRLAGVDDIFRPTTVSFLTRLLNMVVVGTAFMECMFAAFR